MSDDTNQPDGADENPSRLHSPSIRVANGKVGMESEEMYPFTDGFGLASLGSHLPVPSTSSSAKCRLYSQRETAKVYIDSDADSDGSSTLTGNRDGGTPQRKGSTQHIVPRTSLSNDLGLMSATRSSDTASRNPLMLSQGSEIGRRKHRLTAAAVTLLDAFEDRLAEADKAMTFMSASASLVGGPQSVLVPEGNRKHASVHTKDSMSLLVDGSNSNFGQPRSSSDSNVLPLPLSTFGGADEGTPAPPDCSHTHNAMPNHNNRTLPAHPSVHASSISGPVSSSGGGGSILVHPSALPTHPHSNHGLRKAFFAGHPSRPRMRFNEAVATARQMRRMAGSFSMSVSMSDARGGSYANPNAGIAAEVLPMPIVGPVNGESSSSGSGIVLPDMSRLEELPRGNNSSHPVLTITNAALTYSLPTAMTAKGSVHGGSVGPMGDDGSDGTGTGSGTTISASSGTSNSRGAHPSLVACRLAYPTMLVNSSYGVMAAKSTSYMPVDAFAASFSQAQPGYLVGAGDSFSYRRTGAFTGPGALAPEGFEPTDLSNISKAPALHNRIFRRSSSVPLHPSNSFNGVVISRNPSLSKGAGSLIQTRGEGPKEDEVNYPSLSPFSVRPSTTIDEDTIGGGDFLGFYNMEGVLVDGNAVSDHRYAVLVTPALSASEQGLLARSGPAQAFHGEEYSSMVGSIAKGGISEARFGNVGASLLSPSIVRPLEGGAMGASMAYSFHGTSMSSLAYNANANAAFGDLGPMPPPSAKLSLENPTPAPSSGAKALLLDGLTHLMQQQGPSEAVTPRKRRPRALSIDSVTDFLASFVPLGCAELSSMAISRRRPFHAANGGRSGRDRTPSPLASLHSPAMVNAPHNIAHFEMSLMTPVHSAFSPTPSLTSTPMAHPAMPKRHPGSRHAAAASLRIASVNMDKSPFVSGAPSVFADSSEGPLSPPRDHSSEPYMVHPHQSTMTSPIYNFNYPKLAKKSSFDASFDAAAAFGQIAIGDESSPQGITNTSSNSATATYIAGGGFGSPSMATRVTAPSSPASRVVINSPQFPTFPIRNPITKDNLK